MNSGLTVAPVRRSDGGFTLVEVIVVLSVILLLTGIAVPMLSSYMEDGRRARAETEARMLGAAVMSFYKDTGVYPTRDSSGTNDRLYVLLSGSTVPTSNPWTSGHRWSTWGRSATRGDILDNHLLRNTPAGQASAAYPTTDRLRWRGPYIAGSAPLDPWGRPYIINVISGYRTHVTNYKRVFVLSAGPNGRFDTSDAATATTDIAGDDIGLLMAERP
ncbi:MAG: type II secretion system protein GspG [Planctomycetes bacterium]|nr:type II secretion system protein GspG [Planctomycetota bacterium]